MYEHVGRGVNTHPNSIETVYFTLPSIEHLRDRREFWDDDFAEAHYDQLEEDLYWMIEDEKHMLPDMLYAYWGSFEKDERWCEWPDDEVRVVASNFAVEVSVSVYNGIMAVDVAHKTVDPREDNPSKAALRAAWARRMTPRIADAVRVFTPFDEIEEVGTLLTGAPMYELV